MKDLAKFNVALDTLQVISETLFLQT